MGTAAVSRSQIKAGEAFVEISAKDTTLKSGLSSAQDSLKHFRSTMRGTFAGNLMSSAVRNLVDGLKQIPYYMAQFSAYAVTLAADIEQSALAFEVMLGSAEASEKIMERIAKFAATTPFTFTEARRSAKQLIAYGFSAEEVVGEMRMLGDISASLGLELNDLAYVYGTLRSQSHAYAVDIRQFTMRGIPVITELSHVLGIAKEQVMDYVSAGKVGYKEVQNAFRRITTEGGIFANMTERQSRTMRGLFSRVVDEVEYASIAAGQAMIEGLDLKELATETIAALGDIKTFMEGIAESAKEFDSIDWKENIEGVREWARTLNAGIGLSIRLVHELRDAISVVDTIGLSSIVGEQIAEDFPGAKKWTDRILGSRTGLGLAYNVLMTLGEYQRAGELPPDVRVSPETPETPERVELPNAVVANTDDALAAQYEEAAEKAKSLMAATRQFEAEIHKLRIENIDNEYDRKVATINSEYEEAKALASETGANMQLVDAARFEKLKALNKEYAVRVRDMQYDLAVAQLEAGPTGYKQQRDILEIERAKAMEATVRSGIDPSIVSAQYDAKIAGMERDRLERENETRRELARAEVELAVPSGTQRDLRLLEMDRVDALEKAKQEGIDPGIVNRLFDVRGQIIQSNKESSAAVSGSFNARAINQLVASDAATQTAKNTAKTVRVLEEVNARIGVGVVI